MTRKILLFILTVLNFNIAVSCKEAENNVPSNSEEEQPVEDNDPEIVAVCKKIQEQITADNLSIYNVQDVDKLTEKYLSLFNKNGFFTDVNYDDQTEVNWDPINHLKRLRYMVMSYIMEGGKYYQDGELYNKIESAFKYWEIVRPESKNWWHDQIGEPQELGLLLVMMRSGKNLLPEELETKLLAYMKCTGGDPRKWTGANKSDIALHWLYRSCLEENKNDLEISVSEVFQPLVYTTGEGIQYDNSYFQHGSQLYIGGYAPVLLEGIGKVAVYTAGTDYYMTVEQRDILYKFINETLLRSIRGNYIFYNVIGRSVSRENGLKVNLEKLVTRLMNTDDVYKAKYGELLELIKTSDYSHVYETHTNYYIGDYSLYQCCSYSVGVRAYSNRTMKCEKGNGENLKGYFMTEGSMALAVSGDEYYGIFPVWDWSMIPGTTLPRMATVPAGADWEQKGTSDFVGGVSNGKIGAFVYKMNLKKDGVDVSANKSWFFFGKEIYCLGSGIKSGMAENVLTTVNQCVFEGEVSYGGNTSSNTLSLGQEVKDKTDIGWAWHRNVCYIFPDNGQSINLSVKEKSGSWKNINSSESGDVVSKNVFTAWINHGTKPVGKTYGYVIVPGIKQNEAQNYSINHLKVLSNTDNVQAVSNENTGITQVVFYTSGTVKIKDLDVTVSDRCALIVKDNGKSIEVDVATPSQDISELTIDFSRDGKNVSHKEAFNDGNYTGITHNFTVNID